MQNYYRLSIWLVAGIVLAANLPTILEKTYAATTINGAGATFPFPLIDTWRVEYQNSKPDVNINYQSIGSGGGIKQFTEKTVDFGATDAPLNEEEEKKVGGNAVHIPETIGSVAVVYNLPQIGDSELKLNGPIISDIFLGKITKWDDPKIKELNPDVELPSDTILTVHRSDGSGTTFVFTEYLSNVSSQWHEQIGTGKSVQWPVGIGSPGNEGVSGSVKSTPNSIGYVELAYALTTGLNPASIQNKEGNVIKPTLESTSAAVAASVKNLPKGNESWTGVSIVNADGAESYPIATMTYLLLYNDLSTNPTITESQAKALIDFISWAITDGQKFAPDLGYVPLPEELVKLNQDSLKSIKFKGNPIVQ